MAPAPSTSPRSVPHPRVHPLSSSSSPGGQRVLGQRKPQSPSFCALGDPSGHAPGEPGPGVGVCVKTFVPLFMGLPSEPRVTSGSGKHWSYFPTMQQALSLQQNSDPATVLQKGWHSERWSAPRLRSTYGFNTSLHFQPSLWKFHPLHEGFLFHLSA